jgi:hypothetical protein
MDWLTWHDAYADPASKRSRRLAIVRDRIRDWLDGAAPGPLTVVSMCAGQGLDLLPVLAGHRRGADVRARLVENDARNVAIARGIATPARVEFLLQDAGLAAAYAGMVPADLVLCAGVLGNLEPADAERTVAACAAWCRPGGTVIWTRHHDDAGTVARVCAGFERHGLDRVFLTPPELEFCVGVHRQPTAPPVPAAPVAERVFTFVGSDRLRARARANLQSPET